MDNWDHLLRAAGVFNASSAAYLHPLQAFHDHRVAYSSVTLSCLQTLFFRSLFTRGNVFICEGEGGWAPRGERERERERGRLVSDRNKIARERKETETPAICESGLKPNHCPQSPGTCLTASFGNSSPARLPQTTGLWNRT